MMWPTLLLLLAWPGLGLGLGCPAGQGRSSLSAPCRATSTPLLERVPLALSEQCTGAGTTINGAVLRYSRAGQAYCPKSNGTFVLVDANVPRVGRMGLLHEQASTQLLTDVRDWSKPAWVATDAVCTKTATGADGVANAATTCTATGASGTVVQSFAGAAAMRSGSVSIRRRTGGGNVWFTVDGVSWCAVTSQMIVAANNGCEFLRLHTYGDDHRDTAAVCYYGCGALTALATNYGVGIKIDTPGDSVDVDLAQLEPTFWQTSPIFGTSRAADIITAPSGGWPAAGYFEALITPARAAQGNDNAYYDFAVVDTVGVRLTTVGSTTNSITTGRIGGHSDVSATWSGGGFNIFPTPYIPMMRPRMWRLAWSPTDTRLGLQGRTWNTGTSATVPVNGTMHLGALDDESLPLQGWIAWPRLGTTIADQHIRVVTIGDSIMATPNNINLGEALQTALGWSAYLVQPMALGGSKIITEIPPEISCMNRYLVIAAQSDIIVDECGINDILNGASGADTWTDKQTLLDLEIANGKKVVPTTIGPCGGYGTCNGPAVDYFNAQLVIWCAAQGAKCRLADANAYLRDTGNPATMRAACNKNTLGGTGDWLHPSDECSLGLAALYAARVSGFQ